MEKLKYHLLFALLGLFASCSDSNNTLSPNPFWGEASVKFNGQLIEFMPYCLSNDSTLYISMICMKCDSSLDFDIGFSNIKKKNYKIDSLRTYSFENKNVEYASLGSLIGGDVVVRSYKLLESADNFLEITDWNEFTGEIKGKYQATFYDDKPNPGHPYYFGPDTVYLKCDLFHTRIVK